MKYRFTLLLAFFLLISCNKLEEKQNFISAKLEISKKTVNDSCESFDKYYLIVRLKNNHKKDFFITNLSKKNYIPYQNEGIPLPHINGSHKSNINNNIQSYKYYIDMPNKGNYKDTFNIEIPKTVNRFQINFNKDTIDIYKRINFLENVYFGEKLSCSDENKKYSAPLPPVSEREEEKEKLIEYLTSHRLNLQEHEKNYFRDNIVLVKANQEKTIFYEKSSLFLMKGCYNISFFYKPTNDLLFKNVNKVKSYFKYSKSINSNAITICIK